MKLGCVRLLKEIYSNYSLGAVLYQVNRGCVLKNVYYVFLPAWTDVRNLWHTTLWNSEPLNACKYSYQTLVVLLHSQECSSNQIRLNVVPRNMSVTFRQEMWWSLRRNVIWSHHLMDDVTDNRWIRETPHGDFYGAHSWLSTRSPIRSTVSTGDVCQVSTAPWLFLAALPKTLLI